MFLTDCPTCGLRELRGVRAIELLVNHGRPGRGIDLVFRCTSCGSSSLVDASEPLTEHRADPAEAHSVSAA